MVEEGIRHLVCYTIVWAVDERVVMLGNMERKVVGNMLALDVVEERRKALGIFVFDTYVVVVEDVRKGCRVGTTQVHMSVAGVVVVDKVAFVALVQHCGDSAGFGSEGNCNNAATLWFAFL